MADEKKKEAERLKEERAKLRAEYIGRLNDINQRISAAKTTEDCSRLMEEHYAHGMELKKKDPELFDTLSASNAQLAKSIVRRARLLSGEWKPRVAYLNE